MNIAKMLKKNKLLIIVVLTYIVLAIAAPQMASDSVKSSMYYVKEMLQIMPVIFIFTSLIDAWVPRETIMKGFGEGSGIKGPILSFVLGSFSAGPIYAAFPVCKMLLKKGASISNIVIILSSWAVVKVPMLANEAKFLGPKFMGVRWILTTISIFVMAYIMSLMVKKEDIPSTSEETKGNTLAIKEEYCMGCGVCAKLSPENFVLESGKAKTTGSEITEGSKGSIDEAIKKCPAKVIYFK